MEPQLDRIERETGRLNELIGQLLSLSHLESTTRLPDRQSVAVREVIRELLPDVSYEAEQRGCRVNFEEGGVGDFCGWCWGVRSCWGARSRTWCATRLPIPRKERPWILP